jgi:hypothetical protein
MFMFRFLCLVESAWNVNGIVRIFCFDCYSVQVVVILVCFMFYLKTVFRGFCFVVVFIPVVFEWFK